MEEPGVDLFKPQRLSAEALKAGLEHVLDANLAADGRRAVFTAANHHVGIEHQIAVDGAQTEVGLDRRHVKNVLACAVDLDFLVAERRNVGNLEARSERPAEGRNFTARDAERNRHLDIGEVGVRRLDRADRHVIRFQMRDAQADARNELEGTRGKLVLSTHAGGVDVHVKLLVHGRLRSRDLVFRLEPCEFAHHLRITELLAGVSRQAVVLDAVLDGGDVAASRSVAVLQSHAGREAFGNLHVAAEHGITSVGAEAAVVVELVGFVAFTRDVDPEVDAGVELLVKRRAVGNRFAHHEVCTASHGLDTRGGNGHKTGFEIYATIKTTKYALVERMLHKTIERLSDLRVRQTREFFNIEPAVALDILCDIAKIIDDSVISIYEDGKVVKEPCGEWEPPKPPPHEPRRKPFKFSMVGIKPGTVLTFDPTGIKVKVDSDDQVEYKVVFTSCRHLPEPSCRKA